MIRVAVLASHGGSILQSVIDAVECGELPMEVSVVISNNSGAVALDRARRHGIPVAHLSSHTHPDPTARDEAMEQVLVDSGAHWVLLAGYMKKLGPRTLERFRNHIINTHPSLLPKFGGKGFYGSKVHTAVLAAGDQESGATVHLVDEAYDTGPILAQVSVPVRRDDTAETLEDRVKEAERTLIVTTLAELAARRDASNY